MFFTQKNFILHKKRYGKKKKWSRSEKKKCSKEHPTQYKCLTEGQLRVSRMPLNSYDCAHHIYAMCQENFCSCPAIWENSETLVYCPKRLNIVFDEEGRKLLNYKPGTKICLACQNNADVSSLFITSFVHWSSKNTKSNYDVFTLFNILYNYFIWIAKIVLDSLLNNILLQIISFKQQLPPKQFPFKLQTSGILTNENTCPNIYGEKKPHHYGG